MSDKSDYFGNIDNIDHFDSSDKYDRRRISCFDQDVEASHVCGKVSQYSKLGSLASSDQGCDHV